MMADQPPEQPEAMTILLPSPISIPGLDPVSELKLRAPTAGEWAKADKVGGVDGDILLVSLVAGVPVRLVEGVPAHLVNRGARYMMGFFDPAGISAAAS